MRRSRLTARRRATRAFLFVAGAMVLGPRSARAQLTSDSVPRDRIVPEKEQLDTDMQNSRFRLGPVRFLPSFDLSNAGYNSNVFGHPQNPQGDWTATVNVGTKLIVPFGSKFYFLGDLYPGYTWYATFSDLSNFSGTAGAALAGYFNHLSFQVGGRASEGIVVHSEVPAPTLATTGHVFARMDVDLTSGLAFFAGAAGAKDKETQQGVPLPDRSFVARYNRTDEAIQGGFRYTLGSTWTFAPEVQYTTSRFVLTPGERNNQSYGYLLGVGYNRPRFYLNLVGGYREGRPYQDSTFPNYATPVGSYFLSYFVRPWLELRSHAYRRVTYSVDVTNPYYFGMQIGGDLNIQVASSILLKGFGTVGQQKYPIAQPVGGSDVNRLDKITTYGGGASVILARRLTLTGVARQVNDASNIPKNSYKILYYSTFLTFTGEFMR
jgi:hypothetical protein